MPRLRVNYKFTVLHTATATAATDSTGSAGSGLSDDVALLADADVGLSLGGDNDNDAVVVEDERDKVCTMKYFNRRLFIHNGNLHSPCHQLHYGYLSHFVS